MKMAASSIISVPLAFGHGRIPAGLTAPAMRAALVLIARANPSGEFDIMKPELEALAGLRLDAADRFFDRLRGSQLACDGVALPAFDSIEYVPGVQKRLAGIIRGRLSPEVLHEITLPRWSGQRLQVDAGELAKLTTVPGILLWLRLGVERQSGRGQEFRLRLTDEDAAGIFGPYTGRAAIKRKTKSEGEFQWTSLSRIYDQLIGPGIKDLWDAIEGAVVDARPVVPERGRGRAWSHVEITMSKLRPMPSLRELQAASNSALDYERRKHKPTDPAKAREKLEVDDDA